MKLRKKLEEEGRKKVTKKEGKIEKKKKKKKTVYQLLKQKMELFFPFLWPANNKPQLLATFSFVRVGG
jgi:hypothetical protein